MVQKTSKQVLLQVLEPLKRTAVMPHDAAILAFQLLAWADQSAKGALRPSDTIAAALQTGASGIAEALERLASAGGALGQAFNNAAVVARSASAQVVASASAAERLVEGGVFDRYFPADVASDLLPWTPGYLPAPSALVRLLADLVMADEAQSIYCPWEYSGQFVAAAMWSKARLHAESVLSFPLPALMSLFRKGETTLSATNALLFPSAVKGGRLEKFEAILSFPPIGVKTEGDVATRDLYDRFAVPKATATGLMLQHIVAQSEGLAAVIVPNSFLFGPGNDKEVRDHLLRKRQVQAVIALPGGILSSANVSTNISVAILLLNTRHPSESVRFIDATQPHFVKTMPKGRVELASESEIIEYSTWTEEIGVIFQGRLGQLDASLVAVVSAEDVLANDALLQVDRYVMPPDRRRLQALLDAAASVPLEELVEFVSPLPNKDRDGDFEGIKVGEVGAADLPPAGYIQSPSRSVSIQLPKKSRSGDARGVFLRPFDVVLITKGSVGKIGVVPDHVPPPGAGGWIAGQSAVVLRARDGTNDLRALALMLRSRIGQELMASIQSGATIPMMSLSALRRLSVPAFPPVLAQKAIDVIEREASLQREIDELLIEQSELSESLWDNLLTD
jgi:type I restriction enzyme M protein